MSGEPGLDVGAALGRQLAVDIGVQFVLGHWDIAVVHINRLWLWGLKCRSKLDFAQLIGMLRADDARCINPAIISPA
ncbi:hypothetical protein TM233_44870 [Bradyrhizobium sp. TM233]|nr:hypothetical protein TM233_44870 [Bradyrhizobium sp. TM233]